MLKYRILTAIILIPLVLAGIFLLSSQSFQLVSAAIWFLIALEWASVCRYSWQLKATALFCFFTIIVFYFIAGEQYHTILLGFGCALWVVPLCSLLRYQPNRKGLFANQGSQLFFGTFILVSAWLGLTAIQAKPHGAYLLLTLFLIIWSTDTFAYFVGRRWGRRKLSQISPGKSVEGVLGGIAGASLVAILLFFLWQSYSQDQRPLILQSFWLWLVVMWLMSILSVFGDLFESMIKRIQGVKDSGNILPGHGGLLDRLDSLLPTLPAFALLLQF